MSRLYKMDNEIKLLPVIRKKYYVNMQIQKKYCSNLWYMIQIGKVNFILWRFYDDDWRFISKIFFINMISNRNCFSWVVSHENIS